MLQPPTPPSSASTKKRPAERAYENEEGEVSQHSTVVDQAQTLEETDPMMC